MQSQEIMQNMRTHKDVYAIVNDKIIEQLNKGCAPWRKPWYDSGIPKNLVSLRPYRGINLLLLATLGYEHNLFLTFKQLRGLGGSVKRGERSHMVVYWNILEKEVEGSEKKKKLPFLRYYTVFNIEQCQNIPPQFIPRTARSVFSIPSCDAVITQMPKCPEIRFEESSAYYDTQKDFINMPIPEVFTSDEAYYSTLFHELVHSTGHQSRLAREGLMEMTRFGSQVYSHEELVAEIGGCYLQSLTGIKNEFEQSASYIHGWLKRLQDDRKFIFTAAAAAQKATDFILNVDDVSVVEV